MPDVLYNYLYNYLKRLYFRLFVNWEPWFPPMMEYQQGGFDDSLLILYLYIIYRWYKLYYRFFCFIFCEKKHN